MSFKIITNTKHHKSIFDKKLKKYFKYPVNYNLDFDTFNIGKKNRKKISSNYYRNDLLFYNSFKLKKSEYYIFGLSNCLSNSKYVQFDSMPIVLIFTENVVSSGIIFAKNGKNVYLLFKLKFDELLSSKQINILRNEFDIVKIGNKQHYINLGNLNEFSEIVCNLTDFLQTAKIRPSSRTQLKVYSISESGISLKKIDNINPVNSFSESIDSPKINEVKHVDASCIICNGDISGTYLNNPKFVEFAGVNRSICAHCYAKILVSYFKMRIGERYINKSYLLHENNSDLIKSYLDLAERIGVIGRSHEIEFNDELVGYNKYFNKIPRNLKIKSISEGRKSISERVNIIDKETLGNEGLSNDFKKLLFAFNLSEYDGWDIRKRLIYEALSFDLRKTHKHTRERINNLILSKRSEKNNIDVLSMINKLNYLTLNNKGELNESFISKLKENGLNENLGRVIRDILIREIENFELIKESHIEYKIDDFLQRNYSVSLKKFYYAFDNHCYLNAIINDLEFLSILQIFEVYISHFESFIMVKLPNNQFKLSVEFKISINDEGIFDILEEIGFSNRGIK